MYVCIYVMHIYIYSFIFIYVLLFGCLFCSCFFFLLVCVCINVHQTSFEANRGGRLPSFPRPDLTLSQGPES